MVRGLLRKVGREMRRACKRDANQALLTGYLQQCGWHVIDTADVGPNCIPGFPDALVTSQGITVGVEFKVGNESLTESEVQFWAAHGYALPLEIVRDMDGVLEMTRKYFVGRLS